MAIANSPLIPHVSDSLPGAPAPDVPRSPAKQVHLRYLDGLRGAAALYVVVHHVYWECGIQWNEASLPGGVAVATRWLAFGHSAVAVFIVLSGYCLMLPLAKKQTTELNGGIKTFAIRRALRILPPYYAAIIFSLILIALVPGLGEPHGTQWDSSLPAFTPSAILSHLFVVHNLVRDWHAKINFPMWSVGTEWDIYFVFALVFLPILRRFGIYAVIVFGLVAGVLLDRWLSWASFHYMGLFAGGMFGALVNFSAEGTALKNLEKKVPWAIVAGVFFAAYVFLNRNGIGWSAGHMTTSDVIVGVASVAFMIHSSAQHLRMPTGEKKLNVLCRLFETPAAIVLGSFSYSLYLIHGPIVAATVMFVERLHLAMLPHLLLSSVIALVLCLPLAYLFYRAFEKPAIDYRAKK